MRALAGVLMIGEDEVDVDVERQTLDCLVARCLLQRVVCSDSPMLINDGLAVAVVVSGPDWIASVAEAWRDLVAEARCVTPNDIMFGLADRVNSRAYDRSRYAYYVLKLSDAKENPDSYNTNVTNVLSGGSTLVGFAVTERHLPSILLRVADHTIVVPSVDWPALCEAIYILTRDRPRDQLPDSVCAALTPSDLALADRPGQRGDDYVRRLTRIMQPPSSSRDDVLCLDQLHGFGDAAVWGMALAEDLAAYRRGTLSWHDISRGALLAGPPGVGKTTFGRSLAKTCAKACGVDVPLIACSYAKWQSAGHLGNFLKSMMRDFQLASSSTAPSILLIDEIDSFGDRARLTGDNADYSRQCVNALLEQLDGVGGREGVICIGATNAPDQVDPALLRPGRLDRLIVILPPTGVALRGVIRQYLGSKEHGVSEADLDMVVRHAQGMTGADVVGLCRDARRRARKALRMVMVDDLLAEINRADAAPRRLVDIRRAAVHEAGHAYMVVTEQPGTLAMVHIRARGDSGGRTTVGQRRETMTLADVKRLMRQGLAGRAAEAVLLGEISSAAGGPAASDLARVTALGVHAVSAYCLCPGEPPVWLGLARRRLTRCMHCY